MGSVNEKELKFLFPETQVELGGVEFTIRPFSFAETRIVAAKLKDVLYLFTGDITPDVLAVVYDKAFDGLVDVIAMTYQLNKKTVQSFDLATAMKAIVEIVDPVRIVKILGILRKIRNLSGFFS